MRILQTFQSGVGPGLRSVQTRWLVEYTQNGACSNYGNYLG